MIRKNLKTMVITSIVIILPIIAGLIFWNELPDKIAIHWGIDGKADGWGSKAFAVFGLPLFLLAMHWVCLIATSLDPKKQNIDGKPLNLVLWICPVISLFINTLVYCLSLGIGIDISLISILFFGIGFMIIGNYMPKCRPNYSVGIKVSWTLNNEENWRMTHRFAGKVWTLGGLVIIASAMFKSFVLLFIEILLSTLIPIIYSYIYHKRQKQKSSKDF